MSTDPPPPPEGTTKQQALAELFAKPLHWHQRWEVLPGVFTPGRNPVALLCDRVGLPKNLTGARVLDVGAWNGGFSYECERRGAAEVIALGPEPLDHLGIFELGKILGSTKVRPVQGTVYSLDPKVLGTFDIVLFLGVLYHLRHPLFAIDQLRRVARDKIFVESHVIDEGLSGNDGRTVAMPKALRDLSLWQFYRNRELNDDASNWFGPNVQAVIQAFGSAGFELRHVKSWGSRASFAGAVKGQVPEYQALHCYESLYH